MKDPNLSKLRLVNVHQAKTHLSRLMDDAHTGETIVLAKVGQPMSASDALEAVSSTAHPRPVECS